MIGFTGFPQETFAFLGDLAQNNTKPWFDAHRAEYEAGYVRPALAFITALGPRLRRISPNVAFEPKVNGSLFRIQRDVRFSADKTLYKTHLDLWFWHGPHRGWAAPGFFFRLAPERLILGAGMHRFEKTQLDVYRSAVVDDRSGRALAKAIKAVEAAGDYTIGGAVRKRVPAGFDAAHPRAALLLHDGLWAEFGGDPAAAGEAAFVNACVAHCAAMWPIGRWLLKEVAR
jgi:uncharacterized protein (TIGR02453 family)